MTGIFQSGALVENQYKHAIDRIREALRNMPDEQIHANSDDELTDHFHDVWKLEVIEEDSSRTISGSEEREVKRVQRHDSYFGPTEVEVQYAIIELPLVAKHSNGTALQLRGNPGLLCDVGDNTIFRDHDQTLVLRERVDEAQRSLGNLRTMIEQINHNIRQFSPNFRERILKQVQARRERVAEHSSKFAETMSKMGVDIKKKDGAVEPVNVKVHREIRALREKPTAPAEPELSAGDLQQIIGLIDQSGKGIEVTPGSYKALGEEQLRDIILGHLNAVFGPTSATGESFSKQGKTDIFLRVRDGVVLISECKFWGGAQLYGDTINQLFGYLTWRHTSGILVTFSRNKGLTAVVEAAKGAITVHPTVAGDLKVKGETHLVSRHVHPDDDAKTVEVHHLFFNLYAGGGK